MSRRSRRQRRQPRTIQAPNLPTPEITPPTGESSAKAQSGWPTVAVVFGLILVCIALFALELAGRTLRFWLSRDDYIRTELKVTDLNSEGDTVFGIVAATGEEIHSNRVHAAARGKVVPIWFAQGHNSFFSSARVQYVSEFETLPSGTLVLGIAAVNLAILAVGAWCVVFGIRRANARAIPTQQS
jgi:hypothetical protein